MQKQIAHNLFFGHPPAAVWEYLTNPQLMELWLMKNDFKPVVGHQFTFRTNAMPAMDFDGNIYCTVLEVVPNQRLVYSWKGGPGEGKISLDSIVEWTLHPQDNGTELRLLHSGFKETDNILMISAMDKGWLSNMHKIAAFLNEKAK